MDFNRLKQLLKLKQDKLNQVDDQQSIQSNPTPVPQQDDSNLTPEEKRRLEVYKRMGLK